MTVYAQGVDYAWSRPGVADLVRAGKTFACRYGGPGSSGKQLDAAEVQALTSHGIWIVANAEGAADGFVDAAAGVSWARQARDHFRALGMPADRPIYFSADFNAAAGDLARIDTALRAAAGVIGAANVGVYGEYDVMRHVVAAGTAAWRWQTLAWSGGRWATDVNHIEQYRNAVGLGTAVLDLDRAVQRDYGQWGVTDPSAPGWPTDLEDLVTPEDITAIAQAVASKFYGDLSDKTSGLYKAYADRADAGFVQALGRGNAAALDKAPDGDPGQPYRFVRDALRNIVGGPVDQGAILASVAKAADVDEQALAQALAPALASAVTAQLPQGSGLTQAQVEDAVRTVLRTGTETPA